MKRKVVKVKVYAYYNDYCKDIVRSKFSNIDIELDKESGDVRYICGVGEICSCDETFHGLLPGRKVVFCGFIAHPVREILEVSINCLVPIPKDLSSNKALNAGILIPMIAAFNVVNVTLGENIMVVCHEQERQVIDTLLPMIGCVPFTVTPETLQKSNIFFDQVLSCTSGQGVDAIVLLVKNDGLKLAIPENICANKSRITFANGIGIGYDDIAFMRAEKTYPIGYVGKTLKDNLTFALRLLAKNEHLSNLCDTTTKNVVYLEKDKCLEIISHILDCELTDDQKELKNIIQKRRSACLIQITNSCTEITDKRLNLLERIAINMMGFIPSSKKDIRVDTLVSSTLIFPDGSVVVLNCIPCFNNKMRIELHWDGKTVISENGIVFKYI